MLTHVSLALFDRSCILIMYNWETVRRTMLFFLNCVLLTRGFIKTKHFLSTDHPMKSLDLIKSFTNLLYFHITSISGKSVGRTQNCYFCYYRCPEQLTLKKMKWFWKLILLPILSPNTRRFVEDFFSVIDRCVRQIDRAMAIFYNFWNFTILGIIQFKFNSSAVLIHVLPQSMFK